MKDKSKGFHLNNDLMGSEMNTRFTNLSLEEQKLLDDKELDELEANLQKKIDKYQNLVTTANQNMQSKSSVSWFLLILHFTIAAPNNKQRRRNLSQRLGSNPNAANAKTVGERTG